MKSPEKKTSWKWLTGPLVVITCVNLFWAFSLELYADEAYYFLYSKRLDWGYFDHPPMVALLIKLGYTVIGGGFGVRWVFVLLTTVTYGLLYILLKPQNKVFFWLVVFSLFPFHLIGFMALPDVPLIFFTVLFFLQYKNYLNRDHVVNILTLAIVCAGLIYSKYHGLLVLLFTVISNPGLFKRRSFYAVVIITAVLLMPHLQWQFEHDFITFTYQLFEREGSGFLFTKIGEYLIGFLLFNGPLMFLPLLLKSFKGELENYFDRSMFFNLVGFFLFFLFSSFRGSVEANWTIPSLVPALYLGFKRFPENWFNRSLAKTSIVLLIFFRLILLVPPLESSRLYEFHGHQEFADHVKSHSQGLPVVANRYQEASLLSFYLNEDVPAWNRNSRKNQFEIWQDISRLKGKEVMFLERVPAGHISHPYFGDYKLRKMTVGD